MCREEIQYAISYVVGSLGQGMPREQNNSVSGQGSVSEASRDFEEEKETVTQGSGARGGPPEATTEQSWKMEKRPCRNPVSHRRESGLPNVLGPASPNPLPP